MDTFFAPYVGFSLRIDIGGEGKGGEKGFLFLREVPNQALWATRSEVTSLKVWAIRKKKIGVEF